MSESQPDYNGQRTVISAGDKPAIIRRTPKPAPERSPQLDQRDEMASMHKGMENSSRRIKTTQNIDIILRQNPSLLDEVEAFAASLQAELDATPQG